MMHGDIFLNPVVIVPWKAMAGVAAFLTMAIVVNLVLALVTYFTSLISKSGAIGGFVVGTIIFISTGWQGYLVLVTFFVLGTAVTKVKYKEKAKKGIAQEDQGRRGAKHAIANCAAALILGIVALLQGSDVDKHMFLAGFVGAFATALSDTASSEIGQAYGKTTILLTTLHRVPPGTEGAVSIEGTLAGIAASLVIALVGLLGALIAGWQGLLIIVIAAFIGNTLESIIGSTIEKLPLITNEVTNFLNTVIGAGTAILLYSIFH
jgi:uncharacterized protein (TIGR00297 family)